MLKNIIYMERTMRIDIKNVGFTLAEVLITIGIIGVVAAITIPQLMKNSKAIRFKSKFNKSYSTIAQAFRSLADEGAEMSYRKSYKQLMKYFSNATDCGVDGSACYKEDISRKYKTMSGSTFSFARLNDGMLLLPGGELIMFEDGRASAGIILLSVDLNGYNSPPNKFGYDVFTFQYIDGNLYAMGDVGTTYYGNEFCKPSSSVGGLGGISCAHEVKKDSEYFKKIVKEIK